MKYAIDYQPVGDSYVLAWQDDEEPKLITLESGKNKGKGSIFGSSGTRRAKKSKLASEMKTSDFIATLEPDDIIYTELGGQNSNFCLAASRRVSKLLRLPTWIVHD